MLMESVHENELSMHDANDVLEMLYDEDSDDDYDESSYDDLYDEGTNLELHTISKEFRGKKRNIRKIKKLYNQGQYDEARVIIKSTIKDMENLKKEIKKINSSGFSSFLGSMFHVISSYLQAWLAGFATLGIGSLVVAANKASKDIYQLSKEMDDDDQFDWTSFNLYRNKIILNIDATIKILKNLDSECARASKVVNDYDESTDELTEMSVYEAADDGYIDDDEAQFLLDSIEYWTSLN